MKSASFPTLSDLLAAHNSGNWCIFIEHAGGRYLMATGFTHYPEAKQAAGIAIGKFATYITDMPSKYHFDGGPAEFSAVIHKVP